ncbi:hypothetical protein ABG067_002085 [Albugo candida]|uniref:Uncharacterized protein n=1 Tax=Albugo candida TaxID=65357 RepID=A0A024G3U9_9STRA|nr:unnamed protein product [Albugo candida]|eukprot:CCI41529.1 unnamed protein product [Albugo candida]
MIFDRFSQISFALNKGASTRHLEKSHVDAYIEDVDTTSKSLDSHDFGQYRCKLDHSLTQSSATDKTDTSEYSDDESGVLECNNCVERKEGESGHWNHKEMYLRNPYRYKVPETYAVRHQPVKISSSAPNTSAVPAAFADVKRDLRRSRFNSSDACSHTKRHLKGFLPEARQSWPFKTRMLSPRPTCVGWVRGAPAKMRWQVLDHSIERVRIDVCNIGWDIPTTVASNTPNNGSFVWRKVAWGMPSGEGYYINIYGIESKSSKKSLILIGQSDEFTVAN